MGTRKLYNIRKFISAVTFTGVIFHEFGHQIFCFLTGVRVYRVCYFRLGNPAGYVVHEQPKNFTQSFLITVGPLISGTAFALLFFFMAQAPGAGNWQAAVFIWLGMSVAVNAFPSHTDAKNLWRGSNRHIAGNLFAVIGYPFAALIWLANSLQLVFFDVLFALFLYYLVNPGLLH
ncbi:MAG TPA: hypothetical protein VKA10_02415 [Prolixibacteraceae bacterium]|nr:hypothetical protein [Prolixibacteraceae bacterium]